MCFPFFFSSRRRHTRFSRDWSSDVCSSDLVNVKKEIHICGSSNHSIRKIKKLNTCFLLKDQTFYRGSSGLGSIRYQRNNIFIKQIGRASCRERVQTDQKSETDHLCSSLLHQSGSRRDRASGCQ